VKSRLKYEEAAKSFKATWGEHFESRLTADPTHAIERARNLDSQALSEYMRVLRIVADLTVHRKLPPKRLVEPGTDSAWCGLCNCGRATRTGLPSETRHRHVALDAGNLHSARLAIRAVATVMPAPRGGKHA